MYRTKPLAALTLAALFIQPAPAHGVDDIHALVISIDGLRGEWAANPDAIGLKVPVLRKLAARGSHAAAVRGVFPTVTYPSHTTLITGCRPAKHGIAANGVFDPPTKRRSERWYWEYSSIRVPTILDAARTAGWKTAAVSWPVTVDAPVDLLFPEVWEPGKFEESFIEIARHCKPPDLMARVLTRYDLGKGIGRDASLTNVARYLVDHDQPRLMLVHLVELDEAEHKHGPDSPQAREELERIDARVGEILDRYEKAKLLDKTIIAIVSDHGFLPINKTFNVNALLREKGLIQPGEKPNDPARDYDAAGWIAGGSCAIMLKKPDDAATLARVREALAPYVGKPDSPIRRIFERDEIARLGSNIQAALMLDAGEGYTFGGRASGAIVSESKGTHGMHGQFPDRPHLEAAFIAAGPRIAVGAIIAEMQMIDVAPTLAAALGLSLPQAEGRPVSAVLATKQPTSAP